ncbi:restriction endonuclease subunit S [Aeromonas veronii]|uniref:restriction endonuclease subunit S n=1 Tax=Aeromonas veronii TaxID=654 RepID=UPI002443FD58|nr:restriction endonuclease subunit S [Aeromonas veronii]
MYAKVESQVVVRSGQELIPPRMKIQKALHRIRPKGNLNNYFLYYWFCYAAKAGLLEQHFTGTTIKHLTGKAIAALKIPLPPIEFQMALVGVLKTLDDCIALLRETNATLEAIVQALFKSWFVDFDPVHARARGEQPADLAPEVAALFPDSFEESELGMVPRGWKVVSVGDVAEVVKGKSYSSKDLVDSHDTALVTLKSFERGGGFRLDGFKPYSGAYKPSQVVVPGDLIIAYTDVTQAAELIGKPAIVVGVENHQTLVASLDVGIVRPVEDNVSRQFLYGLFRTEPFQSHTFAHTSGTTVLHLAKGGVGSFEFACPPVELVKAFTEIADSLAERRQTNIDQMRTLATLRDTLLPRLISGQLRLSDAEAQLSETGLCQ